MEPIWSREPAARIMIQEKSSTTTVRAAVAMVESVFRIPHLARIDVTPAKNAEPTAKSFPQPKAELSVTRLTSIYHKPVDCKTTL